MSDKDPVAKQEKSDELQTDPLYIWFQKTFPKWRELMKGSFMTAFTNSKDPQEYLDWVTVNHPEAFKGANHAYQKRQSGRGFWDSSPFLPRTASGAFTGARMNAIHPHEDRVLTKRELMNFMGLPEDMKIPENEMGKVFQNVPSVTSASYIKEVVKFINGELELSGKKFLKQDNFNESFVTEKKSKKLF